MNEKNDLSVGYAFSSAHFNKLSELTEKMIRDFLIAEAVACELDNYPLDVRTAVGENLGHSILELYRVRKMERGIKPILAVCVDIDYLNNMAPAVKKANYYREAATQWFGMFGPLRTRPSVEYITKWYEAIDELYSSIPTGVVELEYSSAVHNVMKYPSLRGYFVKMFEFVGNNVPEKHQMAALVYILGR